ncbi:hypothetical protein E2C01_040535 [Portunus trituberculatus]|uniref:Uncharacterized protein n=1 Tax=Portunus trituberculatus TaxID=210409 RepID=A0A5B7FN99_PORTR|nr:hypothetical protein [Portunus trituberculatus]
MLACCSAATGYSHDSRGARQAHGRAPLTTRRDCRRRSHHLLGADSGPRPDQLVGEDEVGGSDSRAHSRRWHQVRVVSGQTASHPHLGWPSLIPTHWPLSTLTPRPHRSRGFLPYGSLSCENVRAKYKWKRSEGGKERRRGGGEGEATRRASKRWVGEVRRGGVQGGVALGITASPTHHHRCRTSPPLLTRPSHHHHYHCFATVTHLLLLPLLLLPGLRPRPTPALATPPDPDWGTRGPSQRESFCTHGREAGESEWGGGKRVTG